MVKAAVFSHPDYLSADDEVDQQLIYKGIDVFTVLPDHVNRSGFSDEQQNNLLPVTCTSADCDV